MYLLVVKKEQICPFKGTAPATSCCTPKGTTLNPYFSVYNDNFKMFTTLNSLSQNLNCHLLILTLLQKLIMLLLFSVL